MKVLASFPIYSNPEVVSSAIASLVGVDKYFVVNNRELKHLVKGYPHIINKTNNYCNGGWNQAMKYFLKKDNWDYLLLSSSDVILQDGWLSSLEIKDKEVYLPNYTISLEVLNTTDHKRRELKGQPAGACTLLPKEAVRLVYPIPDGLRLWFGDEYMYGKLKGEGWKIVQGEFNAYHYGSLSIASNPESNEVIAQDKLNWASMR